MYDRKLMLFDGHGLAYRAFYALPPLSTSKGVPVNAVLGTANMILKAIDQGKATHVAFSFDKGLPAARIDAYEHYKAQREKMPESLTLQMELIRQLVTLMGFPIIELEGDEADDCLATIAQHLENSEVKIFIVTGDRDLLQLVSENINVLLTTKGTSTMDLFTPEKVKQKFGIWPAQLADYKGLAGDSSDNIPGVTGIGPKTAANLIEQFGSLEELYNRIEEVTPEKLKTTLKTYREDAFLSKQLAMLVKDLPIEFTLESCKRQNNFSPELKTFLEDLEMFNLITRLGFAKTSEKEPCSINVPIIELHDIQSITQTIETLTPSTHISLVNSPFNKIVVSALTPNEAITFDSKNLCFFLQELFGKQKCGQLIVHDSKKWLLEHPELEHLFLKYLWHDTMLAASLINSELSSPSLAQVTAAHSQYKLPKLTNETISRAFMAQEAIALLECGQSLEKQLTEGNFIKIYREIELPLIPVLAKMERTGIALDIDYLIELNKELEINLEKITGRIHFLAGEQFNIASNKQLSYILYEKLGLPKGRKTKTGYSTDSDELSRLARTSDIAIELLAYREIAKLKSTYVESLLALSDPDTKRVHTSFNQTVVATGRLSSTNPNLQNIPIRSELGKKIRKAFIAPSPKWFLLSADYSQIELRILAHMAKDKTLINAFLSNKDIHTQTARELYNVTDENVTEQMRRTAKTVNFGIIYGMTEHGLSQGLGISREEAKLFIEKYFERFPGVKTFIQTVLEGAKEQGYVSTLFGRKRYLPDITSKNRMVREMAFRMAVNTPIQGTAAEIIKLAMIKINKLMQEKSFRSKMLLQVHDELLFEVPEEELQEIAGLVTNEMESVIQFDIPLKVNVEIGKNWADTVPLDNPDSTLYNLSSIHE